MAGQRDNSRHAGKGPNRPVGAGLRCYLDSICSFWILGVIFVKLLTTVWAVKPIASSIMTVATVARKMSGNKTATRTEYLSFSTCLLKAAIPHVSVTYDIINRNSYVHNCRYAPLPVSVLIHET